MHDTAPGGRQRSPDRLHELGREAYCAARSRLLIGQPLEAARWSQGAALPRLGSETRHVLCGLQACSPVSQGSGSSCRLSFSPHTNNRNKARDAVRTEPAPCPSPFYWQASQPTPCNQSLYCACAPPLVGGALRALRARCGPHRLLRPRPAQPSRARVPRGPPQAAQCGCGAHAGRPRVPGPGG